MKVVIVGVGALGSAFVQISRNFKMNLKIVDHDRVEAKNVLSQFHTKMGVGKNKTLALQQSMSGLFGAKLEAIPHRLTAENCDTLFQGAGLILDAVDNGETRRVIQAYARKHQTPCLHGAVAPNGEFGRVIWDDTFQIDDEAAGGAPTCEDGAHLPFLTMVASGMGIAVQEFLKNGRQIGFQIHPKGMIQI